MKTTLIFPSYLHLSGFLSVAENGNIEMDLQLKSLTADFNPADITLAITSFAATDQGRQNDRSLKPA